MRKKCTKCGRDQELARNPPRVLHHALPQLSSPVEVEVTFTCATCGQEVQSTIEYRATGTQDLRPRAPQGREEQRKHLWGSIDCLDGKSYMQYPGVFRPAENVLFPAHEGRLGDGGVIGRHGDPDLMAEFAEEYLTQGWAIMPKGRLPRTVSEMMPALNLLVNGVELALKAYLVRGHKRSGGHNLRALYGRLDQDHRREIEGRFAAAAPNANLKALGAKGCTVESTLAVYGTSFGSTVYMDTRYFAEPTEMLDRKSLKGGNLVKTAPYPIFLPHLVQALLGTYAFFSGAERLKRRGADVHRFSRAPKDTHGDWGLTPSSLGLIVIQVAQRVATDDSGAGREAFRKFKTARPPGYCASWMYGGKRLLFYRAGKEHPEDGETVVDGLECRVWCSGRLGMHARDLYLLADALDAPGGLDRFEWE